MARRPIGAVLAIILAAATGQAAAQPAPVADAAPSSAKLELARQLVEATNMEASLSGSLRDMIAQSYASIAPAGTPEAQARRKVFADAQANAMIKITPKIVDSLVDNYARDYTTQELNDLLAFYRSPTGRSLVAKSPQLLKRVTSDLIGLLPQMRHDMGDEACAKVTCTQAERKAFGLAPATS